MFNNIKIKIIQNIIPSLPECLLLTALFELCWFRDPPYWELWEFTEDAEPSGKGWGKALGTIEEKQNI